MPLRSRGGPATARSLAPAMLLAIALGAAWGCNGPPGQVVEHLRRGDVSLSEGRYGAALAAYGHARDLAPNDVSVQQALMRARAYLVAEQPSRVSADSIEDARYEAEVLLDSDKEHRAVYLTTLGNILARTGDAEGAKAKLSEALKADPTSSLAHTALGVVLMTKKDMPLAKVEFEAALRTKPDGVGALVGLAQIKLGEGDIAGAADRLEAALRVHDDYGTRMLLGSARVQLQKPAEAAEQFQRAVQLDPKNPDGLAALGQALLSAGKSEEAERALRAATQMRGDTPTATALGYALQRQKKSDQALGVFNQILAQDSASAPALYGAGMASEELGRRDEALALYQRLLASPADGRDRQMVADLQKDAQTRVAALSAAPSGAAATPGQAGTAGAVQPAAHPAAPPVAPAPPAPPRPTPPR